MESQLASHDEDLPRWDIAAVSPDPASPEFAHSASAVVQAIDDLTALFDTHGIGLDYPAPTVEETQHVLKEVITAYNATFEAVRLLENVLLCLVSADTHDAAARVASDALGREKVRLAPLEARFATWVGALDLEELIARSAIARDHAFALQQARLAAAHRLGPDKEALAAELGQVAGTAWGRLRDDIESQLMVRLDLEGEARELPISEVQNLGSHPDRGVRQQAFQAEVAAWRGAAVPLAAALNGVKGETATLTRWRGWLDPVHPALAANRIDARTLDALLGAIREAYPDYRRYLRSKAHALGLPVLASYDLLAPIGEATHPWPFPEAAAFVAEQFAAYAPTLGALATRALDEQWIDAGPRPGKVGGGFCRPVGGGASRILLNYAPTYDWMSGLAHELGHAYHNAVLHEFGRTWLQRPSPPPMTLAETASTFCERLVQDAALAQAEGSEQVVVLDGWLQVVGINVFQSASDFTFEQALFTARRKGALLADELEELTLAAQREVVGEAVDPATLNPSVWAALPHLYSTQLWYYNFPYAFGLLFGLGLFAQYQADPGGFPARFEDLLSRTGMATAEELAAGFGIDVRSPAFWRTSLDLIRGDIDRLTASVM